MFLFWHCSGFSYCLCLPFCNSESKLASFIQSWCGHHLVCLALSTHSHMPLFQQFWFSLIIKLIQVPEVNKIKLDQNCDNNNNWLPGVNLNHLPEDQHLKVQKLLTKECEAFLKSENDIGHTESLKLKIIFTDPTPVCKLYDKIPTQLYSKVKQYIENLLTNEWIKPSYSSCASPMAYVRKGDGSIRHYVDKSMFLCIWQRVSCTTFLLYTFSSHILV